MIPYLGSDWWLPIEDGDFEVEGNNGYLEFGRLRVYQIDSGRFAECSLRVAFLLGYKSLLSHYDSNLNPEFVGDNRLHVALRWGAEGVDPPFAGGHNSQNCLECYR